jgi:phospholipid-binding lipoprotein MlaA
VFPWRKCERGLVLTFLLMAMVLLLPLTSYGFEGDLESLLNDDYGDEEVVALIADPLEPVNRVFFTFNDSLYYWVVKPVGKVYSSILAEDIRTCISDAFHNILAPVRVVNHLLQGELRDSGTELSRFVINTTFGAGGLGDPAGEEFGIMRKKADFGQTLGKYGVGNGLYICWPVIGPSSARDSLGLVGDYFLNPLFWGLKGQGELANELFVLKYENEATLHGDKYEAIIDEAIDPYVSMRDIYVQYRQGLINNRPKAGSNGRTKPDSFRPEEDCPGFVYADRYDNKIKARHHEQCRNIDGFQDKLVRYTRAGKVYYGVSFPERY